MSTFCLDEQAVVVHRDQKLAEGRAAHVVRGSLTSSGAPVAVKIMQYEAQNAEKVITELQHFCGLIAACGGHHVGLVDVHGFIHFPSKMEVALVMEPVGKSLQSELEFLGGRAPNAVRVAAMMLGVVEALRAVHERQKAHLALRPSQLLAATDGVTLLVADATIGNSTSVIASRTPHYNVAAWKAPEQFNRKLARGHFTDVYAVGAVLWSWLRGGDSPWKGFDAESLMIEMTQQGCDVPPLIAKCGDAHKETSSEEHVALSHLAGRCLQSDPTKRPTVEEVVQLLRTISTKPGGDRHAILADPEQPTSIAAAAAPVAKAAAPALKVTKARSAVQSLLIDALNSPDAIAARLTAQVAELRQFANALHADVVAPARRLSDIAASANDSANPALRDHARHEILAECSAAQLTQVTLALSSAIANARDHANSCGEVDLTKLSPSGLCAHHERGDILRDLSRAFGEAAQCVDKATALRRQLHTDRNRSSVAALSSVDAQRHAEHLRELLLTVEDERDQLAIVVIQRRMAERRAQSLSRIDEDIREREQSIRILQDQLRRAIANDLPQLEKWFPEVVTSVTGHLYRARLIAFDPTTVLADFRVNSEAGNVLYCTDAEGIGCVLRRFDSTDAAERACAVSRSVRSAFVLDVRATFRDTTGFFYLRSPTCTGGSLADWITSRKLMTHSGALFMRVMMQVAEGLHALHSAGQVHGCLTAATVLASTNLDDALPKLLVGGASAGNSVSDVAALGKLMMELLGADDNHVPWRLQRPTLYETPPQLVSELRELSSELEELLNGMVALKYGDASIVCRLLEGMFHKLISGVDAAARDNLCPTVCCVCTSTFPSTLTAACSGFQSHRYCRECMSSWITAWSEEAPQRHIDAKGALMCTIPDCGASIDKLEALKLVSDKHCQDQLDRVQHTYARHQAVEEFKLVAAREAAQSATQKAIRYVDEEIVSLRCPHCKQPAFINFDECLAITCPVCKKFFCGYCTEPQPNNARAHAHVNEAHRGTPSDPSSGLFPHPLWTTQGAWQRWWFAMKRPLIDEYVAKLDDPAVRNEVLKHFDHVR